MLPVYVDLYLFNLLYFRRVNDKEVLPDVCSTKTQYQVYSLKRAGVRPGPCVSDLSCSGG